ncbi:MAG: hypothetical protein OEY89_06975, partial [Gammaproteobacteria bacterium]|nr:hypothetical protein [Gammaproteobacteria bacterium]
ARTDILGTDNASTLHGAIFDVMVGTGLMGLIPWGLAIFIIGKALMNQRRKIKSMDKQYVIQHNEFIGLFALIMVRSLTSSGIAFHEHTFMIMLIIVGYLASLNELYGRKSN